MNPLTSGEVLKIPMSLSARSLLLTAVLLSCLGCGAPYVDNARPITEPASSSKSDATKPDPFFGENASPKSMQPPEVQFLATESPGSPVAPKVATAAKPNDQPKAAEPQPKPQPDQPKSVAPKQEDLDPKLVKAAEDLFAAMRSGNFYLIKKALDLKNIKLDITFNTASRIEEEIVEFENKEVLRSLFIFENLSNSMRNGTRDIELVAIDQTDKHGVAVFRSMDRTNHDLYTLVRRTKYYFAYFNLKNWLVFDYSGTPHPFPYISQVSQSTSERLAFARKHSDGTRKGFRDLYSGLNKKFNQFHIDMENEETFQNAAETIRSLKSLNEDFYDIKIRELLLLIETKSDAASQLLDELKQKYGNSLWIVNSRRQIAMNGDDLKEKIAAIKELETYTADTGFLLCNEALVYLQHGDKQAAAAAALRASELNPRLEMPLYLYCEAAPGDFKTMASIAKRFATKGDISRIRMDELMKKRKLYKAFRESPEYLEVQKSLRW